MKKYLLTSIACLILCVAVFYAGVRYGDLNARVEVAATNTGPLMNLLLIGAGKNKEFFEMNHEQLYMNIGLFDSLRTSWLVSTRNKKLVEQRILFAKDYWQAVGGTIVQTEEEKRMHRESVEDFRSKAGITPNLTINGVNVSPFYFEEQDQRARELFSRYADQKSYLYDFIIGMAAEGKTEPNQPPQRNAGSRPLSDDLPASETPSSLGPRG